MLKNWPYNSKEEISLKEFQLLTRIKKEEYVELIISIPVENRSIAQKMILTYFSNYQEPEKKSSNFFSI